MTKKIVIANWKMGPATLVEAQELFSAEIKAAEKYQNVKTVICPPFVYLEELSKQAISSKQISNKQEVFLGAQDVFWENPPAGGGAFTGEASPEMLRQFGVNHVLVGHSDRRYVLGESDEVINKKIRAALTAGITPVLLVGEREVGDSRQDVLIDQLSRDLEGLVREQVEKVLIAYEPVWAISTQKDGQPAKAEDVLDAVSIIKSFLDKSWGAGILYQPVLYGGSIDSADVADFLKHPEIGGAIVGAASLNPIEFSKILELASQ